MTVDRVNEIFRQKYPDGEVWQKSEHKRYEVVFRKGGRVYGYVCGSYAELLNRLGFKVATGNDIASAEAELKRLEKELNEGPDFAGFDIEFTEEEEKEYEETVKRQIECQKAYVKMLKTECILV